MALNFVAAESGLEEDPKLLTLARLLKVDRAHAFWFVMRWRRLVVNTGHPITGSLPREYSAADLASFVDWSGKPAQLAGALKATGFLRLGKRRELLYPSWSQTVTGQYVGYRERERRRKEADRNAAAIERKQGAEASADRRRKSDIKKGRTGRGRPPAPPPCGGGLG